MVVVRWGQSSLAFFALLALRVPVAMALVDRDGRLIAMNPAFIRAAAVETRTIEPPVPERSAD